MPYQTEIIIASILVAGFLIYQLRPKHKELKLEILLKYRRIRSKSLMLQDLLSSYILKHDAVKQLFLPDVTYGEFLRQLKKAHSLYLSEKVYIKVKNSTNIVFLKKTERLLEEQEQKLNEIEEKVMTLA